MHGAPTAVRAALACLLLILAGALVGAQGGAPAVPPPGADQAARQRAVQMAFAGHEGSGTAWLPGDTPLFGLHQRAGSWELMWSGSLFAQYVHDAGDRGRSGSGSVNWGRVLARREAAGGRFGLRAMLSAEPWSIDGCGAPNLLATGGTCGGEAVQDRQHARDLFLELAAEYERPVRGALRWQVYAALAGEPALGPVASAHRTSSLLNPRAPITSDRLDASPASSGVVTAGVFTTRWKAEASAFSGRDGDDTRTDIDLAALDSFSGRVSFAPGPSLVLQVSGGRVEDVVAAGRTSASATYHRRLGAYGVWATTAAWGRRTESGAATHAFLVESTAILEEVDTVFARVEVVEKTSQDLDVPGGATFTVTKGQAGYTHYLPAWRGISAGLGGSVSAAVVPAALKGVYGARVIPGAGVFLAIRGAPHGLPPAPPGRAPE